MQIQQRVHLHCGFVLTKLRPREQGQTEVDGGRIERIEAVVQFHTHCILAVKRPGNADQMLREIGEDAPVVSLVGICQGRARNPAAKAHVVQLAAHRAQTGFYVAKTLAVSELSETHCQKLIPARQHSMVAVTVIANNTLLKFDVRQVRDQLRENSPAGIHPPLFRRCPDRLPVDFQPVSVQIVFWRKPAI